MVYPRSDPLVKSYMTEHPEVVKRIEKLYLALREKSFAELLEFAYSLGIDIERHKEQAKGRLITDIVKSAPDKALEVIEGQGILPSSELVETVKRIVEEDKKG